MLPTQSNSPNNNINQSITQSSTKCCLTLVHSFVRPPSHTPPATTMSLARCCCRLLLISASPRIVRSTTTSTLVRRAMSSSSSSSTQYDTPAPFELYNLPVFFGLPSSLKNLKRRLSLVLTCEHASEALPPSYTWSPADRQRLVGTHWASDIGAAATTKALCEQLDVPGIATTFSRLLVRACRII